MPKGEPLSGKRTINPHNKPGPTPKPDDQKKKRREFWLTEAEYQQMKQYLQSLRS